MHAYTISDKSIVNILTIKSQWAFYEEQKYQLKLRGIKVITCLSSNHSISFHSKVVYEEIGEFEDVIIYKVPGIS